MNKMKTSLGKILGVFAVLGLLLGYSLGSLAAEVRTINLEETLGQVFKHNTSHFLFLWEQGLLAEKEALERYPKITTEIKPVGAANGQLVKPEGNLTMKMPIAKGLDLSSTISLAVGTNGVDVIPSGNLVLNYDFFALPNQGDGGPSLEESLLLQGNALVSETINLFIELRQKLDLKSYEEGRYYYLEASLEAARLTPNYDDLKLKREFRDQAARLAKIKEELNQLQLRLGAMLGESNDVIYDPVLEVAELDVNFVEGDLLEELFATNSAFRKAQAELSVTQARLAQERKTKGWSLRADGGISVNAVPSQGWNWNAGLTASKTLYPSHITLEELELAVAKAEHGLSVQKNALAGELRSYLQAAKSAAANIELKAEHLAEAKDDFSLRQRQFEAGLVTELQMEEARLVFEKTELDYGHSQMSMAQSVLRLWSFCGRDLPKLVFELVN